MKKEDDEINRTLYACIANALCAAFKVRKGKWVTFEKLWLLANCAQLASNFRTAFKDNPSEHHRHIAKLLCKATRLRSMLDTFDLERF